jgi:hypothetical protein
MAWPASAEWAIACLRSGDPASAGMFRPGEFTIRFDDHHLHALPGKARQERESPWRIGCC